MTSRGCKNHHNSFCYVCGYYVGPKSISYTIEKGSKHWIAYNLYFGMEIGDQDKGWAQPFMDSSIKSLKGVLLHNGNAWPSIPVAHSANMKEDY